MQTPRLQRWRNIPEQIYALPGVVAVLGLLILALSAWSISKQSPAAPYHFIYPRNFGNRIFVPADNPATEQGVYLGRLLFYEKRLSANDSISCATCHQQEKAFTDGRAFSTGVDGKQTSRNAMSLANLLWSRKFFWDGRASSLEQQADGPLTDVHEMDQSLRLSVVKLSKTKIYPRLFKQAFGDDKITGDRIIKAIAQFERTLISCNSKYDRYLQGRYMPTKQEMEGMNLFMTAPDPAKGIRGANCAHCHGGVKNYMGLFHNNGLDSLPKDPGVEALTGLASDLGRFKAPTLRNIALTGPYMHDGRFKTLAEVVDHYSDHVVSSPSLSPFLRGVSNDVNGSQLDLRPAEKKAIIAFLNMLTDSTFIKNKQFSDPKIKIN